jgi:hypothetical protein
MKDVERNIFYSVDEEGMQKNGVQELDVKKVSISDEGIFTCTLGVGIDEGGYREVEVVIPESILHWED